MSLQHLLRRNCQLFWFQLNCVMLSNVGNCPLVTSLRPLNSSLNLACWRWRACLINPGTILQAPSPLYFIPSSKGCRTNLHLKSNSKHRMTRLYDSSSQTFLWPREFLVLSTGTDRTRKNFSVHVSWPRMHHYSGLNSRMGLQDLPRLFSANEVILTECRFTFVGSLTWIKIHSQHFDCCSYLICCPYKYMTVFTIISKE